MVENEIPYLSRDEFCRMAPSIVGLEMARLGRMLQAEPVGGARYNALVRARYELRRFVAALDGVAPEALQATCAVHLQAALMAVSLGAGEAGGGSELHYVFDRLRAVHDRMNLLY